MNMLRLREAIRDLAGVVEATSTKRAGDDVRALEDCLSGGDDRKARDAVTEFEDIVRQEKERFRAAYVDRLNDAGTDRALFEPLFAELSSDKRLLTDDANAIAHAYTQGREKWPTKSAALGAIKTLFGERAYQVAKMKIVEKTRVW